MQVMAKRLKRPNPAAARDSVYNLRRAMEEPAPRRTLILCASAANTPFGAWIARRRRCPLVNHTESSAALPAGSGAGRFAPLAAGVLLGAVLLTACAPPAGDALERVRALGYFTWGADQEGGGPYIYPDPAEPSRLIGFEVELASLLAGELSRELGRLIEARFSQGQWDNLLQLLDTGRVDVVLNGYEWSPERARRFAHTIPYYIYELQLMARAADERIAGWADLAGGRRWKVGVLSGSAAESYLRERFGDALEVIAYDGNTNAMADVANLKLDATLQDLPIALFYGGHFPALRRVGEPVAPGRYVIYLRPEDTALREALDRAISALRDRGELRRLFERHGIWTETQDDLRLQALPAAESAASAGRGGFFARYGKTLLQAAGMTVFLSIVSMPLAMLLGLLVALGRLYGPRLISVPLAIYVEVLRGTPLMLQLFFIFYLLPSWGLRVAALPAAIIGLAVNYSAYESEIYRAGLLAVPAGQMEAALSLGMSKWLALRRIIIPQAVRIVIPPVTNDFIALFKDTSVCSVITVVELTKQYNISVMSNPSEILPLAGVTAVLYLAMSYPLSVFSARMEKGLRR
jgi:polar amino acid transport system substrate-binding protein